MARSDQDRGADALLDLDGEVFVVDPKGEYWVRFVVRRVERSPERPHGLNYSLTLQARTADGWSGSITPTPRGSRAGPAELPRAPTTTDTG